MEKTVNIGGRDVRMRVSARIPFEYRNLFGKDIIIEMQRAAEQAENSDLECFENLAWLMAKNAGEEVHADLPAREAVMTWLDEFEDMFAIYSALPEITELWTLGTQSKSKPRKK